MCDLQQHPRFILQRVLHEVRHNNPKRQQRKLKQKETFENESEHVGKKIINYLIKYTGSTVV